MCIKQRGAAALGLLLLAAAGCSSRPANVQVSGPSPYGQEGLKVSGTAIVRAEPDLAVVTVGCDTRASRAGAAKAQNDATMRRVLDAVRARGVASKDIQTVEYSLGQWSDDHQRGWQVSNLVQVRVRDVDRTADVLDAAADAGANRIGSVDYQVESLHALRAKAREQAAKVAREKAQQLADLMGVRLGQAVAVSDTLPTELPWYGLNYGRNGANVVAQSVTQQAPAAGGGADKPDDQLASGRVSVTAREEITFAIER